MSCVRVANALHAVIIFIRVHACTAAVLADQNLPIGWQSHNRTEGNLRKDTSKRGVELKIEPTKVVKHPAGRSLNLFWRESSNKFCHTEELLPAAILVITRVTFMKIRVNLLDIRA